MKLVKTLGTAISLAALAVTSAPATEIGRPATVSEWAPGTWQLAARMIHEESPYANPLESSPRGLKLIHADGRFAMMIERPHRPPSAVQLAKRSQKGKPLLADVAYGTWSVDEEVRTITFRFEMSTFPSWGREETRVYSLHGDRWSYVNPEPMNGEDNIYLEWKRVD